MRPLQSTLSFWGHWLSGLHHVNRAKVLRGALLLFGTALLLLIIIEKIYSPVIEAARYRAVDDVDMRTVTLPMSLPTPPKSTPLDYELLIDVNYQLHHGTKFRFIPDDCVKGMIVNGKPVNLSGANLCNWRHGFRVDLKNHLVPGKNIIYVVVTDNGPAMYGLDITPYFLTPIGSHFLYSALIFLALAAGWRWIARKLDMDLMEKAITFTALYLYVVQIIVTPYLYYNFDTGGHLFYLSYVYNNLAIPSTHAEWQTYQPPFYYIVVNLFHSVIGLPMQFSLIESGRYISLFASMAMLIFAFLAARLHFGPGPVACMTLAFVAFWPLAAATAARLSNEVMCYAFWSGALYYLLRWHQLLSPRDLFRAALLTILTYATKMNGIVMIGILVSVFALHLWREGARAMWNQCKHARPVLLTLIASIAFVSHTGRTIYYNVTADANRPLLVGNFHDEGNKNPQDDAENALWQFLYFDYQAYLRTTHFSYYDPSTGTPYFWNTFLKTLMFTDSSWNADGLMMLVSFVFLLFIAYLSVGLWRQLMQPGCWTILPFVISFALMILALAAARVYLPKVGMADGRYIYPILMLMGLSFGHTLRWYRAQGQIRLAWLGYGLYGCFIALNLLFLLMQRW